MVARITTPKSTSRALNYNEQKVQAGKAECLEAGNFLSEADELNFYQKLERFEHQNALNERAKTNTLHISLNFDATDKLSREKLVEIADGYMDKIGFGEQPYLVYQHHDAGHPHLHIVTTSIQNDGSRINTFNIGKNQSERARKELELEYNLVRAESKNRAAKMEKKIQGAFEQRVVSAAKIQYGKMETKRAIQNVLDVVISQYKYSSLPELNAILKQYNVMADRGTENSITYQKKGLYYRILDEDGNKIGVPVKASLFHQKPTLNFLEQKFEQNVALKSEFKKRVKIAIDWTLHRKTQSLASLEKDLQKEAIQLVIRRNEDRIIYGVTYIDYKNKVVFNGSDLGKEYSAKGVIERLAKGIVKEQDVRMIQRPKIINSAFPEQKEEVNMAVEKEKSSALEKTTIELLMGPAKNDNYVPSQLTTKKKKRKRQSLLKS
ncbi:MAG: relaxase/mobilization nuclease domain-containing protein [Ferruginibacter sp.]